MVKRVTQFPIFYFEAPFLALILSLCVSLYLFSPFYFSRSSLFQYFLTKINISVAFPFRSSFYHTKEVQKRICHNKLKKEQQQQVLSSSKTSENKDRMSDEQIPHVQLFVKVSHAPSACLSVSFRKF